jgi:mRNA interferase MazF
VSEIKRGDVFWVSLNPAIGSEIKKTRPCVIVSNDVANRFSPLVTVVPITTQKLSKIYPHEVSLNTVENLKNSKVKAHQIRTIDKKRIGKKITSLPQAIMSKVDWALANHLDLEM